MIQHKKESTTTTKTTATTSQFTTVSTLLTTATTQQHNTTTTTTVATPCPEIPSTTPCPEIPSKTTCPEITSKTTCPECQQCEETPSQETAASNSSLLEFYNEVMTFNDSVVELVCCKLDGSNVSVSCGKGLSCAAACYSREAVLCPSHNCEDCDNVDEVSIVDEEDIEQRKQRVEERKGGWSWATQFSGKMSHCTRRGCQVGGRFKYCCFHPVCRKQKRRQCSWFQYFLGKWCCGGLSLLHLSLILGTSCPRPGFIVHGEWSCEKQQIPIPDTFDLNGNLETYPGSS